MMLMNANLGVAVIVDNVVISVDHLSPSDCSKGSMVPSIVLVTACVFRRYGVFSGVYAIHCFKSICIWGFHLLS